MRSIISAVVLVNAFSLSFPLGFYRVDALEDSNILLEGTSKNMRHNKVKNAADIDRALLKNDLMRSRMINQSTFHQ
jgi:hypothetical protein